MGIDAERDRPPRRACVTAAVREMRTSPAVGCKSTI